MSGAGTKYERIFHTIEFMSAGVDMGCKIECSFQTIDWMSDEASRGCKNAYFTVEAAMVFPVVISTILFVVYILLFQYDRCLQEQDVGAMALWGSRVEFTDTASLATKTQERITQISREKYAAWEITVLNASLERNKFTAVGTGQVRFPVPGWSLWGRDNVWEAGAEYSYERLSPVAFVRLCRKVRQRQEENANGG